MLTAKLCCGGAALAIFQDLTLNEYQVRVQTIGPEELESATWLAITEAEEISNGLPPSMPSGPSPANGATNVSINTQISILPSSGATSYDVYFGTGSPPPFVGSFSSSSTSNAPLNLSYNTSYYWKVVAKNSAGSMSGPIWSFTTSNSSAGASIVAWGSNAYGQTSVPSPNSDFAAVAAGHWHSLGLRRDGSIAAWGAGMTNTGNPPDFGQAIVPSPNGGFVALAAGAFHSLALKADGSIVAWGQNVVGQTNVPSPNGGFVAIAAGEFHCLALRGDGSIVAWGSNHHGQTNVPVPNSDFVAVAAGEGHSVGLKSDGSIRVWGYSSYGDVTVPAPNSGFMAVAAGLYHCAGLKADGSVVAWGWNFWDQTIVPTPNSGFVAVAAGGHHSLGLRGDGSIVAWGWNADGQATVPSPNAGFVAMAAGREHSLGLKGDPASPVPTPTISPNGGTFTGSVQVTLACSDALATIQYTTNGSDPTSTSTLYAAPFTLTNSATVKARAFRSGYNDSEVAAASFTIQPPVWIQRAPLSSPLSRWLHAMAFDSGRQVTVLFGGFNSDPVDDRLNDTWEWNGTTWVQRSPPISPSARTGHSMAYDSSRGMTMLFGGGDGNDTWEWNGSGWIQRSTLAAPRGRNYHSMAYDAARGVMVLFGGAYYDDGTQYLADTWEWNGTNWAQRTAPSSPPARRLHAMCYDSTRGVSVLFGGDAGNTVWGDTWEWNGTTWTQRSSATSPPSRAQHGMAYDSSRRVSVLFGGWNGSNGSRFSDTWEWNGLDWVERMPITAPQPRTDHAMAYDAARSHVVLFGGLVGGSLSADTWEYGGP
ncbi:MAG: chitobiase/beta-hexosaminidase C-terminal domain-containing protein [Phycisphaerae bacterium]|nr:chitobiase/beta-hexosaminidase C-terminal domain-containing protein [Phycisphaerae bacterium]